ncbi:MAG: thiamine phosphate synthase [Bacillota bacterium]
MRGLWRVVDAELNRAAEGLRVLEDLARFVWEDEGLTSRLKIMRLHIARLGERFRDQLMENRAPDEDLGLPISQHLRRDDRGDIRDVVLANFKRIQEGLRSLEEHLKVLGFYETAKECEMFRFEAYAAEKAVYLNRLSSGRRRLPDTDLYCITSSGHSRGRSNLEIAGILLDCGVRILQYREKDFTMKQKYRECAVMREMTAARGACMIVNDDVHLALAVQADGVHLGQDDLPLSRARELVGDKMLLGLSTHSPLQADEAVKSGADYIGVGPLYRTATKKDVCAPVGLEYLEYAAGNIAIPFVAIGGIKLHNVGEVVRRGAKHIAMVTEIVGAEDIPAVIAAVRAEIAKAKEQES